jgi:hypothetical protein
LGRVDGLVGDERPFLVELRSCWSPGGCLLSGNQGINMIDVDNRE